MDLANDRLDQAGTLRALRGNFSQGMNVADGARKAAGVVSVTSGKGGVGKTAVCANIAVSLARTGKKILIIDADLGLANLDVVFGLTPKYNLNHFFSGEKELEELVVEGPEGIQILPAGSGVQSVTHLSNSQKMRFMEAIEAFHGLFDLVLIDTEAGISENVTYFNVAAQEILVVTTPEPTSITDAYALMKLLSTQYHEKRFNLVVNSVSDESEALEVYRKLTMVANRYLDISIDYLGCAPFDKRMRESVSRQKVMVELYPNTRIAGSFEAMAQNLMGVLEHAKPKGTTQFFWKRLLSLG
ncbi:site-determining protein [Desulfuromonas versatilis]|uniref:Site-determining protein n=1 Tax=Desulfuromonas versatilis TaxID=2802975 RepID=A0ABM8HX70_9BACT|nr:MinD/ParA family protein [Desulfuromonas versatilis]BCR06616.1 site-determining protein [Desulfuromonas versatilis]